MTRDEIMKLKGRELDYKIAKEILDLDCLKDPPYGILLPVEVLVKEYSADMRAAYIMEERIAELELIGKYCKHLNLIANEYWDAGQRQGRSWQLIHASPEDRCHAALLAKENL